MGWSGRGVGGVEEVTEGTVEGRVEVKALKAPFLLLPALQSGTCQVEFAERSSYVCVCICIYMLECRSQIQRSSHSCGSRFFKSSKSRSLRRIYIELSQKRRRVREKES